MTEYKDLSKQKRRIVDIFREHNGVVNSFFLKIHCGIVQVSVRIKEMREDGWPFLPKDQLTHHKDGSVDYVLDLNSAPQELKWAEITKNGRTFMTQIPVSEQLRF